MVVKKNHKEGTITITPEEPHLGEVKLEINGGGVLMLKKKGERMWACQKRAAHLWPILKLYSETGKIFEDRYEVKSTGYDFYINGSDGSISGAYKTKDAAQLVCDAMNEAARMEEE